VLGAGASFLQVEGADNARIVIEGGDLSNARAPITTRDGASVKTVTVRS